MADLAYRGVYAMNPKEASGAWNPRQSWAEGGLELTGKQCCDRIGSETLDEDV
jgi:hypothetical protein